MKISQSQQYFGIFLKLGWSRKFLISNTAYSASNWVRAKRDHNFQAGKLSTAVFAMAKGKLPQ